MDSEGEKDVIPATCAGDIKETISSALLFYLSGKPPLFGDIKYVDDELVMVANCGASSLYYAGLSENHEENLKEVTIQGQCQGASGGALTYRTPPSVFTVVRLIRKGGECFLLYFLAEGVEITGELEKKLRWGKQWPHTAIRNPLDKETFISAMGPTTSPSCPATTLMRYGSWRGSGASGPSTWRMGASSNQSSGCEQLAFKERRDNMGADVPYLRTAGSRGISTNFNLSSFKWIVRCSRCTACFTPCAPISSSREEGMRPT